MLRAAQMASLQINTPGIVTQRLFEWIARHYFRENRIVGAVDQLRRMGYVSRADDDCLNLYVPECAWNGILSGDDPEPLSDLRLHAIIVRAGHELSDLSECSEVEPPQPKAHGQKPKRAARRHVLLADHRLAETWYKDALPSPLAKAIVIADQTNRTWRKRDPGRDRKLRRPSASATISSSA